eukprot:Plantae.Rhodophyta-Rhodochaete_pulchella.ctg79017.p1 GENE.Plantae.Rhodophyta-Rhodochaete_pulchella.ctg79017~~Plantae.Rhodophyta-Rhodochaete_pulchella.ctg79017.p1  ORF type:complete len:166 (-),score=11.54 Plantae.Rhodophyta-Rhodochaete_pulchella.ctg79017:69-506(-)
MNFVALKCVPSSMSWSTGFRSRYIVSIKTISLNRSLSRRPSRIEYTGDVLERIAPSCQLLECKKRLWRSVLGTGSAQEVIEFPGRRICPLYRTSGIDHSSTKSTFPGLLPVAIRLINSNGVFDQSELVENFKSQECWDISPTMSM